MGGLGGVRSSRVTPAWHSVKPALTPSRLADSRRDLILLVVDRKHDFTDHVTLCEALVRLTGLDERIAFGDWNLELRGVHRCVEAIEFANSGNTVVRDHAHAAPLLRRRFDAVRVRDSAAAPKHIKAFLQRVATGESQHGIDAFGCEAARLIVDVDTSFAVDN